MRRAGLAPDPWQVDILTGSWVRLLVLCSRQTGKSTSIAALALATAIIEAPSLVLIVSRALRQSVELFRKVKEFYRVLQVESAQAQQKKFEPRHLDRQGLRSEALLDAARAQVDYPPDWGFQLSEGSQLVSDSVLSLEMVNGSRIISLPASPDTIVGFSKVNLLIIDEAARVPDPVYLPLRPMLAVAANNFSGRLACLSTPKGKRGWFYEENQRYEAAAQCPECAFTLANPWVPPHPTQPYPTRRKCGRCDHVYQPGLGSWDRIRVTADECSRLPKYFLEEEKESMGERWYRQEYQTSFEEVEDAVFREEDIQVALKLGRDLFDNEDAVAQALQELLQ